MKQRRDTSPETLAVHAGIARYEHNPVVPPIFQVSTFAFESAAQGAALFAGQSEGYIYTRMGNPTVEALEKCIAALEGGYACLACASGMAAIHTAFGALLRQGDHVVCSEVVYGPTSTLLNDYFGRFGIEASFVDTSEIGAVERAFRPNTRVVYVETPANPTLVISDLEAISNLAHDHGAVVVVDNTFMSPILQQPLHLGADVVVHSLTKFLNGHADVIAGAVVVNDRQRYDQFRKVLNQIGGVLSPFESFLVHRGIKTLALRMKRHCESAQMVAEFLESHPAVEWVRYPGLKSHPQYGLGQRQSAGGGSVISFGLRAGFDAGVRLMNSVKLFTLAVSLGGVESLIEHPASMTHASMSRAVRAQGHITDGLVRVSVGIEDVHDLIADLDEALDRASSPSERRTDDALGEPRIDSSPQPA